MTRWILPLGTLVCLAFVCACNAQLAGVGNENGDAGTTWGEGTPAGDASYEDPWSDASAGEDGGTIWPDDASTDNDGGVDPDATCSPPPPPPPPCGCPTADASAPDDAEAPLPAP